MRTPKLPIPGLLDLHIYGGAALIGVGCWMFTPWLGPLAVGLILLGLGLSRA